MTAVDKAARRSFCFSTEQKETLADLLWHYLETGQQVVLYVRQDDGNQLTGTIAVKELADEESTS
jgi:hypothetical protein